MAVERATIAATFETHGTLEAENEVDLVARASGPIELLDVEAGDRVREGRLLARLDQGERRAQVEIARVELEEAQRAWERVERLADEALISTEETDQARARLDAARAQLQGQEIALGYTEIRAPFSGLVVRRYVKFAQNVQAGNPLFRLSDFDPLLCPIQVPERELPRLAVGQPADVRVEAFPGRTFSASVLRISPVVDAGSGTVEVTLEVDAEDVLRPGMFARVALQLERRPDVLVVPKVALALDGLGDAVFVAEGDVASRRELVVGARDGDRLEVVEGVEEGESVVVVGQDGLADGTPIRVVGGSGAAEMAGVPGRDPSGVAAAESGAPGAERGSGGGSRLDPSEVTPEKIEEIRERMRERGLSEEQIRERVERMRAGSDDRE